MQIEYQDCGVISKVIITSTIFELRKHNRVVDATLLVVPDVTNDQCGLFFTKTVLTGKNSHVLRAYRVAVREAAR